MGVDVVLKRVQRGGTSPKRRKLTEVGFVADESDVFARLCEGSGLPMLSRVDAYGDLILTSTEMDQFLSEIETLSARVTEPGTRSMLTDITGLARQCLADPTTELFLEGD